jgi:hypothetical protein
MIVEERVGVEPTLPRGKPDFESGAFGHSAISPFGRQTYAAYATEGQALEVHVERRGKILWAPFPSMLPSSLSHQQYRGV